MRVVFITRSTLFSVPGGDTIQVTSTAKYLRKLNVEVDIALTNEKIDYSKYDLIHFFNIIRPADILKHIRSSGKPYVVSPIFVDYSEFDKKKRSGIAKILSGILPSGVVEYLKTIARCMLNNEKINSLEYLFLGHNLSIKKIIKGASHLLPNSHNEYTRLLSAYKVPKEYTVVPNAIDIEVFGDYAESNLRKNLICVARIEGLKNQLNLIYAIRGTNYHLKIVGKASPNHLEYYNKCLQTAGHNVQFINHVSQEELKELYLSSKVHILPSWFETTGLSSLEAAFLGCNIVVTEKGDTKEYFKDYAYFCDPDKVSSIKEAIDLAVKTPYNPELKNYILKNFTWDIAASATYQAYKKALET